MRASWRVLKFASGQGAHHPCGMFSLSCASSDQSIQGILLFGSSRSSHAAQVPAGLSACNGMTVAQISTAALPTASLSLIMTLPSRSLTETQACAGYKLQQRALHVFREAARVPQFRDVCNSSAAGPDKMAQLAQLMNDSQTSCRWGLRF